MTNSLTPCSPSPGVNAAAADAPAPSQAAVATLSDPMHHPAFPPASETSPCASALALFPSQDPGHCGFEFAEFPDFAFRKYASTFRVVASSEIVPMSSA